MITKGLTREELTKEINGLKQELKELRKSHNETLKGISLDEELKIKLLKAVNTNSDAIFLTDVEGIITYINSGFTALYGFSADEVVGKFTPRIIKSGLLEKEIYEDFWQALKNNIEVKGEILNRKKNGELVVVEGMASSVLDEEGEIIGFLGIQRDFTVYKQAEENLKSSELKFRTVIDYAYEWEYWQAEDHHIVYMSPSCERISGYTAEEFISNPKLLNEIVYSEDFESFKNHHDDVFLYEHRNDISELEYRIVHKDGSIITIDHTCRPIFDVNEKYLGRRASNRNITVRKQAEKALRESEEIFRTLFESSKDGIFMLSEEGTILAVNRSFANMHGYTIDELKGMPWKNLVTPEIFEFVTARMQRILTGESIVFEVEHFCKNGSRIPLEVSTNRMSIRDDTMCILAFHRDISERKKAEAEISLKNKELLKLNSEKDKFFSIISHDLRNPFNAIIGYSELLIEQIDESNYEKIEEYAHIILNSSELAMDLLMKLMEWSRSQSGRIKFNPVHFEIVNLIDEITPLFNGIAGKKSISIKKDLPANLQVYADQAMISTVLRNLISNSIKFTNPNGKILISAEEKQNEIIVSVSDTGIGIPKNAVDKLFRIDESYSTSGTHNESGTGLGLVLCKEFIEKHGGRIWVSSIEDIGSNFYFSLPIKN